MQYIKILCYFCGLSIDDEYSLYHDFSNAITARDIKLVENIIDFVEQRNNPFKKDNCNVVKNIARGTIGSQDALEKKFLDVIKEWETNTNQTPGYTETKC